MGYTSDVGIALGFDSEEQCDTFITSYKIKDPELWRELISPHWKRPHPTVLVGKYDCVKWYGKEPNDIEHMLEFAIENFTAAYRLIRIGEEFEDVRDEVDFSGDVASDDMAEWLHDFVQVERRLDIDHNGPSI